MASLRNAQSIMEIWDKELDIINTLEDGLNEALERLLMHRPGNYRHRLGKNDEALELANQTYVELLKQGGASRATLRELRSIKTRFPGQVLDPDNGAYLVYSIAQSLIIQIQDFVDIYTK
ncbi:hypothetical protein VRRI112168_03525 [Vreelandella rituensis]|uniref:Uncharacterized protein n=1 Tax=Vreelandella rituensis TaxID=2282306 RepID=A0A368UDB3_9GAMM|nr:hypothetical protein [Halomonas rituensis]RCV93723.1 hypothetical protein DU506_00795 [Halomonas rituensis]